MTAKDKGPIIQIARHPEGYCTGYCYFGWKDGCSAMWDIDWSTGESTGVPGKDCPGKGESTYFRLVEMDHDEAVAEIQSGVEPMDIFIDGEGHLKSVLRRKQ